MNITRFIITNIIHGYPLLCSTVTAGFTTPHLFRVDSPSFSYFAKRFTKTKLRFPWNRFLANLQQSFLKISLQNEMFESSSESNISEARHFSRSIYLHSPFTLSLPPSPPSLSIYIYIHTHTHYIHTYVQSEHKVFP